MKTVLLLTLASVASAQQFDRNVTFSGIGASYDTGKGDRISIELTPNSYCGVKYLNLPYKVACKVEVRDTTPNQFLLSLLMLVMLIKLYLLRTLLLSTGSS
jgi:hypothetical protein